MSSFFKIKTYVIPIVLLLMLSMTTMVYAKKAPKIDICHFDEETLLYKKLNISENGWLNGHQPNHPKDGIPGETNAQGVSLDENCIEVQPSTVFARVFRERGELGSGFDSEIDDVYVELVDGNGNEILDAGDLIKVYGFPTIINNDDTEADAGVIGTNITEHTIQTVDPSSSATTITVFTASDKRFRFQSLSFLQGYQEIDFSISGNTFMNDEIGSSVDKIDISAGSPSQPQETLFSVSPSVSLDNLWLEVEIY